MKEWLELSTVAGQSADWLIRAFFILLFVWLARIWYPDWKSHQTKMLQAQSNVGQALNVLTSIFIAYITSSPSEARDLQKLFRLEHSMTDTDLEELVTSLRQKHRRE